MPTITTPDGIEIFFKDWGDRDAPAIMFHHGWPLSADDWNARMLFFAARGFRVIAHDRCGHGRSEQVGNGHDISHYVADVAALADAPDLRDAVHVGHSTGGGEVARHVARARPRRVSRAVLVSAVTPIMVRRQQPGRGADRGVRRRPGTNRHRSRPVLRRLHPALLRLQPRRSGGEGSGAAELMPGAKLISHPGYPHGMPVTHAERINTDLLHFIRD